MRRTILAAAALVMLGASTTVGLAAAPATAAPARRPVVFVHGAAGSAAQFETQAKRFAGNGYPVDLVDAIDYDYTFTAETSSAVLNRLEQRIDQLRRQTGATQVDLVAHSLGTFLSQDFLRSWTRAAKVAHYVNLDGATALSPPGGVSTLAIWGEGATLRRIWGATNVYQSDQSHTQTVTSVQSFQQMYRFFTGGAPATTDVVAEPGPISLSGRAVLFPANDPATGTRVDVYEVDPGTGRRRTAQPLAQYAIGADGAFGPFSAAPGARYEFAVNHSTGQVQHQYFQPFQRTDRLIRLLTNRPGEGIGGRVPVSPRHSALTITRYKEWWGDQGTSGDSLTVDGVELLNAVTAPRERRVIGVFAHDQNLDQRTDTSADLADFDETFLTGIDVYIPADADASGAITLAVRSRAGGGTQRFTVPNWPSDTDRIAVTVADL
ncbi:alpha/beta fold hydrolase [Catellatospora tritici]|uniref:alpha/beta fold hydrolase n=1 Tax=Catellatospora tritici TaxID=2851566 RepID=UPI001C2DBBAC|nr:alpha/beta fold hydrolase [Catellatospora tritici]MBV1852638.1 alpha/beta hydrolase [Catellatospora tritici]